MLIGSVALSLAAILFFVGLLLLPSLLAMAQLQQQQQRLQATTTTTTTTISSPPPSPISSSPSLSITTTPPLTPEEQEQQNRLQSVIAAITANLNETQKQVSGVVFTPRWSEPVWINANSIAVLLAYCLPGEFADSGQEILGGFGLEVLESYAVALPQGFMAWMAVVGNEDDNIRLPAALGVICASDLNNAETRVLSPQEQQEINNINQQFTTIQNTQITNIENVVNIINNVTITPPPQNETGGVTEQPLTVEIIPNATEVVFPTTFRFEATVTGGTEPYTYSWNTNRELDPIGNEKTYEFLNPPPGIWNVTVTVADNRNQTAYDSMQVTVVPPDPPTVEIIPNATEGVAPATFRFEANINANSRYAWGYWDFGDGQTIELTELGGIEEPTVEHTFEQAGTYNVRLLVDNPIGRGSDNIIITVIAPPGVPPPTVPEGGEGGGVTVESIVEPEEGEEADSAIPPAPGDDTETGEGGGQPAPLDEEPDGGGEGEVTPPPSTTTEGGEEPSPPPSDDT